jgi:hypothetical protein
MLDKQNDLVYLKVCWSRYGVRVLKNAFLSETKNSRVL